jgi:hypothetical protein
MIERLLLADIPTVRISTTSTSDQRVCTLFFSSNNTDSMVYRELFILYDISGELLCTW